MLAAAATGSTLALAGCSSLESGDGSGDGDGSEDGPEQTAGSDESGGSTAGEASATVAVDIQEDLQAAQADVQQRLQEGNLTQEEAQVEIQETQLELLGEAVSSVESYAGETDGLSVSETNQRAGAVLVSGDPAAVLGVLDADGVAALLSADEFPEPQNGGDGSQNAENAS
ncbi:hypothetical protein GJ633_13035 [Halorubrum sp. CBA1125]|nr:hypothetical protein [Halorubrum sp. CBA1125]